MRQVFIATGRRGLFLPFIVALTYSGLTLCVGASESPVLDEIIRLRAGTAYLRQANVHYNSGNPPLNDFVAVIPVVLFANIDEYDERSRLIRESKALRRFVALGRVSLLAFAVLTVCFLFLWDGDLFDHRTAIITLLLWCFDPLVIAHGALITGDMCATAMGVAGMYAFWKWMQRPSMSGAVICGIAVGFVLLSKYVWVVMPVLWAVLWAVRRFVSPRPERWPLPGHLAVMAVLAMYVVNVGYAFESTFQPWRTFQFNSPTLQQFAVDPDATSGLSAWLGAVPVPLPRNYIMGIDVVAHHVQTESFPTYVHGKFYDGNVWWFHIYGLLVKMPLGTWLLLFIAVYARVTKPARFEAGNVRWPFKAVESGAGADGATALEGHRTEGESTASESHRTELFGARHWFTDLVLWLPAITILVFVSWVTQIKLLRYILPMLPFVFIWIGHAFVWAQEGRWWRKTLVYGALAWSVGSSLWVYPHSLSYFNEAAGGTANGHAYLIGASFDWGQDLIYLKQWLDAHPDAKPLRAACFRMRSLDFLPSDVRVVGKDEVSPGWYVISANILRGSWRIPAAPVEDAFSEYRFLELFLDETPVDRVAYSIFIYHLDCDQANAMRAKLGLELLECDE